MHASQQCDGQGDRRACGAGPVCVVDPVASWAVGRLIYNRRGHPAHRMVGITGDRDDDQYFGARLTGTIDAAGCQLFSLSLDSGERVTPLLSGLQKTCNVSNDDEVVYQNNTAIAPCTA